MGQFNSNYFILALCFILAIGGVSTSLFGLNLETDMRRDLAARTQTLAASLPTELINQLSGQETDIGTAPYERLKSLLRAIQAASKDCRFIYLTTFKNKEVVFLVDSEPVTSPDYSPPGQIYQEASAALKAMAGKPQAFVEGPESDRWGTWVTGFDVIKDPNTGKLAYQIEWNSQREGNNASGKNDRQQSYHASECSKFNNKFLPFS